MNTQISTLNKVISEVLPEERRKFLDAQYPDWPIPQLTKLVGVMYPQIVTLVGEPGGGKSTLGAWLAKEAASRGFHVMYCAAEPTFSDVAKTIVAQVADMPRAGMRDWSAEINIDDVVSVADYEWTKKILLADVETVNDVADAMAILGRSENPLKLAVIDYAQYISGDNGDDIQRAMDALSRVVVNAQKRMDITVIVLAQFTDEERKKNIEDRNVNGIHYAKSLIKASHVAAVIGIKYDPAVGRYIHMHVQKARNGQISDPFPLGFSPVSGMIMPEKLVEREIDLSIL